MLTRVQISNINAIDFCDIDFQKGKYKYLENMIYQDKLVNPVAFYGSNGSGKSSFFQAILHVLKLMILEPQKISPFSPNRFNVSKEFKQVLPCIDFAHVHARSGGGFNTYEDFCAILEKIGTELGDVALNNFHAHLSGIAYSEKGEKHHLPLKESDMNYKDLLKAMKKFEIKGAVVCESPNIEDDCQLIKEYYRSLW